MTRPGTGTPPSPWGNRNNPRPGGNYGPPASANAPNRNAPIGWHMGHGPRAGQLLPNRGPGSNFHGPSTPTPPPPSTAIPRDWQPGMGPHPFLPPGVTLPPKGNKPDDYNEGVYGEQKPDDYNQNTYPQKPDDYNQQNYGGGKPPWNPNQPPMYRPAGMVGQRPPRRPVGPATRPVPRGY